MTALLEIRETIIALYVRLEKFIRPLVRFVVLLVAYLSVSARIGADGSLSRPAVSFVLALLGMILPVNLSAALLAVVILLHLYAISLEAAVVGAVILLAAFLLYFRFSPHDTWLIILTPIASMAGIPYVMPIAAGLLFTPMSAIPVGLGAVIAAFLRFISANREALSGQGGTEVTEVIDQLRYIIDGVAGSEVLRITVLAFVAATVIVYLIRRLSVAYSWLIAILAGAFTQLLVLIIGAMARRADLSVGGVILGMIVSVAISLVIWFFLFNLDYSSVEEVQFGDDRYYYYVKAVPKVSVSAPEDTGSKSDPPVPRDEAFFELETLPADDFGNPDGEDWT